MENKNKQTEDYLKSFELKKTTHEFDSKMSDLFRDAKYYSKHNKSKSIYYWIVGAAACAALVFVISIFFSGTIDKKLKPETQIKVVQTKRLQQPVVASFIKLDTKYSDFFSEKKKKELFLNKINDIQNFK